MDDTGSKLSEDLPQAGSRPASPPDGASAQETRGLTSLWPVDSPASAGTSTGTGTKPPLLVGSVASPVVAQDARSGSLALALVAGAAAALVGGLLWAGVVILSKYDIGILAWFVGAATGAAILQVAGGPIGTASRALGGLFAAAGIIVGKYVIFVHEVKQQLGTQLAALGRPVGYLDTSQLSIFVHHFGSIVRPVYALWVALAFFAAYRVGGGKGMWGRRR